MRNGLVLLFAGLIILVNGFIWKSSSPTGMFITPFALAISSGLIILLTKQLKILFKSLLLIACAVFQDQFSGYSGGKYDSVGDALMTLFFVIGAFISFLLLFMGLSFTEKEETWKEKFFAIILYPAAIILYLQIRIS